MSENTLKFRILGCGSSGGVPRIGDNWGECDPKNSKNRRTRCSLLISRGETNVLIDTSPDMREQLLAARVGTLDAVLFTHDHADQTHGIDDLRVVVANNRKRIQAFLDPQTESTMRRRFGYCFETPPGSEYPPILDRRALEPFVPVRINGLGGEITALPFPQTHGKVQSLGFRIGTMAYSSDVSALSDEAFDALKGLDCWILDALRYAPHPTHAHVARALEWIARAAPKRAILTNLHVDLDYETLRRELPDGVEPAYDGMTIELAVP